MNGRAEYRLALTCSIGVYAAQDVHVFCPGFVYEQGRNECAAKDDDICFLRQRREKVFLCSVQLCPVEKGMHGGRVFRAWGCKRIKNFFVVIASLREKNPEW